MAVTSHNTLATTTAQFRDLGNVVPAGTAPAAPASLTATAVSSDADRPELGGVGRRDQLPRRAKGPGEATFVQLASGVTGTGYQDYRRALGGAARTPTACRR